jgi:PAS domain-containing protein
MVGGERDIDAAAAGKPELPLLCRYLSERSPQPTVAVEGAQHVVSYVNPAFARLVGRDRKDLIARTFAEAVPEGEANGCLALLDRVFRTGAYEVLAEQEHRQVPPRPAYWSYAV